MKYHKFKHVKMNKTKMLIKIVSCVCSHLSPHFVLDYLPRLLYSIVPFQIAEFVLIHSFALQLLNALHEGGSFR